VTTEEERSLAALVERLRALNTATFEVHAASSDTQVMRALLLGARRIADSPAWIVRRHEGRATLLTLDDAGVLSARPVAADLVDALLEPAEVGMTKLVVDDSRLVPVPASGVPLADELGEPMAAVLVADTPSVPIDEVLPLLAQLAMAVSLARANMRALDVEHQIALTLQRSLLPQAPPAVRGVAFALRYVAAAVHAQVGGDFYDAFVLDDGTVGLAIGDVVGHSVQAAATMGEIRHAVRAYAIDGYGPQGVIERLERLVAIQHPGKFCTAIYGVLDVAAGRFASCNAGHLPLLHVSGGDVRVVKGAGALLGIGGRPPELTAFDVRPGDRLVMVTDGLVERRDELIDVGLDRLRAATLEVGELSLDAMVDELIERVGPGYDAADDIAVLAVELEHEV
jgi:hypothetical protein